jgi:hypothetical protein
MKSLGSEVKLMVAISRSLEMEYQEDNLEWEGSAFQWIKTRPSRQVGAIGEKLVAGWLASHELNVARSGDSEADRVVEGRRVEIKFSTRWAAGGYRFQQLRDQRYDFVICLGVSPFDAHCWVIPKEDVIRLWKVEHQILSQHGGEGGADTAWIDVNPENPPAWLAPYGGSLSDGIRVLCRFVGFTLTQMDDGAEEA